MHYENTPAHAFAVRTRFAYALALALALFSALLTAPFSAYADEGDSAIAVDKADFYSEVFVADEELVLLSGLLDVAPSEEMRYFAEFESHKAYDATFSSGDGYNAMGYYQFDRRYGLQNFIVACYEQDPVTFSMFAPYAEIDPETELYVTSIKKMTIRESYVEIDDEGNEIAKTRFTEEAAAVNAAWKAAYAANPVVFAALQDAWAYEQYYIPAEKYLRSRGIEISDRADCVKGLCWGMYNLFGGGGWRKFVGGVSDGYDWDGVYHYLEEGVEWPGCGLSDDMTDTEFVTTLCNYVVENVAVFYKGQPQYHEGWQNRYKKELAICLEYLADDEDQAGEDNEPEIVMGDKAYSYASDVVAGSWYVQSYEYVMSHGIMNGNDDGTFAPGRDLKREEAAAVLYNYLGNGEMVPPTDHRDVPPGRWYSEAVSWCVAKGYMTGYAGTDKFGVGKYLTRQELACIVARVANANLSLANASKYNSLGDNGKTSSWARDSLVWAVDKGIINGKDAADGSKLLAPKDNVTRAQIAAIMMNSISRGIM